MSEEQNYLWAQEIFLKLESEINTDIENSAFQYSLKALYRKCLTIDRIKDGIIASKDNLYAAQILHRSLIEHYLIGYYIFLRFRFDDSDKVGVAYYDFYQNSEFLKQELYDIRLDDIRNGNSRTVGLNELKDIYPELNTLSQKDMEEYHRAAGEFLNIKQIGAYLIQQLHTEPFLASIHDSVFELLSKYNLLSSYVHGGPYAERNHIEKEDERELNNPEKVIGWSYVLATMIKIYLVLALRKEYDGKYKSHFTAMFRTPEEKAE